jgi:hypothetical protein
VAWRPSVRGAWAAFWPSRLVVFGVATWVTVANFVPAGEDVSGLLGHPFTGGWPAQNLLDLVFSPLTAWDGKHYLAIAYDGYVENSEGLTPQEYRYAFFPLYPGTVGLLSGFGASAGATLIAAYAVSLSCFFGALALLHRLVTIEIGERFATPTLLLLSFFPTALFFGIPYSESMFLLLAVAAFLAARTGHWAVAGVVLALASATRAPGLLLVVPVALLYLYGSRADRDPGRADGPWPRYPIRLNFGWLLLAPLGLLAFSFYLHLAVGDWFAWNDAQALFGRHNVDPFTGAWAGVREAGKAVAHLTEGTYQGTFDYLNLMQLAFVLFALAGGIGALRVLPPAYGAWVLVSLLPILVSQTDALPFYSAPRFVAVLFPLFIWLAIVTERRQLTTRVVAVFAAGMAVLTAQFPLWSFVA